MRSAATLALAAGVLACGGASKRAGGHGDLSQFDCNDRLIEYSVTGGFVAHEAGIRMECVGERPRLTRWTRDKDGEREPKTVQLSGEQFDATWEKIEAAGWRFLARECDGSGVSGDPRYLIEVADSGASVALICQRKELPFPYDRLVNELDLRAAGFGDDAGAAP